MRQRYIESYHKVKSCLYRKDIVKNFCFYHLSKWILASFAGFTIIFSPLAQAKELEKMAKNNLKQHVVQLGLDKKITLGQFWENAKPYIPGYVYKDIENFVKENKNMLMPAVSFETVKSTDGTEVPVLRFEKNGKTYTAQFFQEKDKWVKYNGVSLSYNDLSRVEDVFKRLVASDINLKKEADAYEANQKEKQTNKSNSKLINQYKKDFGRFSGFPRALHRCGRP